MDLSNELITNERVGDIGGIQNRTLTIPPKLTSSNNGVWLMKSWHNVENPSSDDYVCKEQISKQIIFNWAIFTVT